MANYTLAAKDWDVVFGIRKSESDEMTKWVDFAHIMALEKTKIICGKGFTLETEDEKLKKFFEELNVDSHLFEELQELCYWVFKEGTATIGFDRLKDGSFRMYVLSGKHLVRLAKSYKKIVGASIYKVVQDSPSQRTIIWERWNDEKVERSYFHNRNQLILDGILANVPKEDILPESEPNPFDGIIPFQDVPNYAFSDKPDWWPARHLVKIFNAQLDYYMIEMKNNRSRIVFNVPDKTKIAMKEASDKQEFHDLGYLITTNDEQAKVTPSPSTLLFDAIESAVSSTLKRFFALSSSAYNADITGSGDASTATEQNLSNSGQINSIDCTRSSINAKMTLFLKKMCQAAGFEDPQFTFSMNQNTSITQRELLDETVMKITHGLMGRVEGISNLDNIPVEDAELKLEKINSEATQFDMPLEGEEGDQPPGKKVKKDESAE